ncbi:MAG: VOC family protein [Saprospiraceae bacterium]|nr:VOC family protein [Saprospiraceae bacterium]
MHTFSLDFIDHIAIRVKDLSVSETWYSNVLGLKVEKYPKWGEYPVFMSAGNFAVALFPARLEDPNLPFRSKNIKIDHFAFRVDKDNFLAALAHFKKINLVYTIQNHYYYESVYLEDPDGHCVELTRETGKK